jgi:ubiquinone/menaquinone biosynthesis C-methylase UbiE
MAALMLRRRCFQFYWRVKRIIAPQLPDAQSTYERRLHEHVAASERWLDIGCGHQVLQAWRGDAERGLIESARFVVGLDLEQEALKHHRSITRRVSGDLRALPFPDGAFDLVTANMVLEHLPEPLAQLREIERVLRPGGVFLALTPNLHGYQALLARCIPERFKAALVKLLQDRASEDVFPTYYRINTGAAIEQLAAASGFAHVAVNHITTEAQLIVMPPLVVLELLFIRLLMTNPLRRLRPNLIAVLQKGCA